MKKEDNQCPLSKVIISWLLIMAIVAGLKEKADGKAAARITEAVVAIACGRDVQQSQAVKCPEIQSERCFIAYRNIGADVERTQPVFGTVVAEGYAVIGTVRDIDPIQGAGIFLFVKAADRIIERGAYAEKYMWIVIFLTGFEHGIYGQLKIGYLVVAAVMLAGGDTGAGFIETFVIALRSIVYRKEQGGLQRKIFIELEIGGSPDPEAYLVIGFAAYPVDLLRHRNIIGAQLRAYLYILGHSGRSQGQHRYKS